MRLLILGLIYLISASCSRVERSPKPQKNSNTIEKPKEVNPLGPDFDDLPFSIPEIPTLKTDRSLNDRIILPRRMFSTEPLRRIRPFIRATVSEPEKFQGNLGLARLGMKLFTTQDFLTISKFLALAAISQSSILLTIEK